MLGAIAGDIIGSPHESWNIKTKDFRLFQPRCRFTDDSVLTVAIALAILGDGDYLAPVLGLGRRYPRAGYGGAFREWLHSADPRPYNSWGNGSAMRVSPVGWAFDAVDTVLGEAARSAGITHNHPEGIRGAQAVALAVVLARTTHDKAIVKSQVTARLGYDLQRTVDGIRPSYRFEVSCQRSVPEAITAFLESTSYEDAVRHAVSLGGDSDTLACIAGAIAEAYYVPLPPAIRAGVEDRLPADLWKIAGRFCRTYCLRAP